MTKTYHRGIKMLTYNCLIAAACMMTLLSCARDEPSDPIKPREERKVLLLSGDGHIYNLAGEKIMDLPDCDYASEIISDGDDYFVSGKSTKDRVGYWKNGKWNTLHVDFIEDVEHETEGIGKWDYYIYLYDYPHVLKNSGIFPLEDCENFITSGKCLSVFEGKCYVVGTDLKTNLGGYNDAVLYYERKGRYAKEILPKPREDVSASAHAIYAYGDHTLIGGRAGNEPAIWVDKQLQVLPRSYEVYDDEGMAMAGVVSMTRAGEHVVAGGYEYDNDMNEMATIWVDGKLKHLSSGDKGVWWSTVSEVIGYGDDLYVLTMELVAEEDSDDSRVNILIWLNDTVIAKYNKIDIVNFVVL